MAFFKLRESFQQGGSGRSKLKSGAWGKKVSAAYGGSPRKRERIGREEKGFVFWKKKGGGECIIRERS